MEETRTLLNKMFIVATLFSGVLVHTSMPSIGIGNFLVTQSIFYTVVMWYLKPLHNWLKNSENLNQTPV